MNVKVKQCHECSNSYTLIEEITANYTPSFLSNNYCSDETQTEYYYVCKNGNCSEYNNLIEVEKEDMI